MSTTPPAQSPIASPGAEEEHLGVPEPVGQAPRQTRPEQTLDGAISDEEPMRAPAESPAAPRPEARTTAGGGAQPREGAASAGAVSTQAEQRQEGTPTADPDPPRRRMRRADAQRLSGSPGQLPPFDWDGFRRRYERALAESDQQERELLAEFDRLVKYFNVWTAAASAHDTERATKRLRTRETYVETSESRYSQKKGHLDEVVQAFQNALALLGATSG